MHKQVLKKCRAGFTFTCFLNNEILDIAQSSLALSSQYQTTLKPHPTALIYCEDTTKVTHYIPKPITNELLSTLFSFCPHQRNKNKQEVFSMITMGLLRQAAS